jgi:hypothetical protein
MIICEIVVILHGHGDVYDNFPYEFYACYILLRRNTSIMLILRRIGSYFVNHAVFLWCIKPDIIQR